MRLFTVISLVACLTVPLEAKRVELVTPVEKAPGTRRLTQLQGFGGTPNSEYLPLGLCQGDCDEDSDVR